nr:hypothetical protein GCM10020185_07460 [Pseudomonas brassicacearum subsp. brassicacearum]
MICNLLLVDDHSLIRAGVRALVMDIPGYAVIGEASDGTQLVELVERLNPDIVLLDISMKDTCGLDALQQLKRARPPQQGTDPVHAYGSSADHAGAGIRRPWLPAQGHHRQ